MKIAYLLDWDLIAESGVLKKIESTINEWETQGHEVHLMIVSHKTNSQFIPKVKNVWVFTRRQFRILIFSSLKTFCGRNHAFGEIFSKLQQILPDAIYYRPGTMWYPNISRCLTVAPVILEINSIDENEAKLFYRISGVRYRVFNFGRRKIIGQAKGIIALTHEIADYMKSSGKPVQVIANGICVTTTKYHKSFRTHFLERPQLLFIGSPGQAWQGFDKVVELSRLMPEVDFHLVGPDSVEGQQPINLKVYGYLKYDALEEIYKVADIGIGTLALYLKEMEEACPLKVREYILFGLPVILGYRDTDLDGQDFVLNIGCHENNIGENLPLIRQFVHKWHTGHVSLRTCEQLIGMKQKEMTRLFFIKSIIEKSEGYS